MLTIRFFQTTTRINTEQQITTKPNASKDGDGKPRVFAEPVLIAKTTRLGQTQLGLGGTKKMRHKFCILGFLGALIPLTAAESGPPTPVAVVDVDTGAVVAVDYLLASDCFYVANGRLVCPGYPHANVEFCVEAALPCEDNACRLGIVQECLNAFGDWNLASFYSSGTETDGNCPFRDALIRRVNTVITAQPDINSARLIQLPFGDLRLEFNWVGGENSALFSHKVRIAGAVTVISQIEMITTPSGAKINVTPNGTESFELLICENP